MDDNTTNKGGRPKKKLSEKRNYSVLLKLNTKEYFTLKSKANEAGLNKSEYLRTLIYESQVKARITPEQMNEIRQLTGIANNINQIARRLNTYGISAAPTELKLLRIYVDKHLKDLKLGLQRSSKGHHSLEWLPTCWVSVKGWLVFLMAKV